MENISTTKIKKMIKELFQQDKKKNQASWMVDCDLLKITQNNEIFT
jgi:hypothetical protein